MPDPSIPDPPAERAVHADRIGLSTAIVLAVAGLLSAWASFQSAMWSGVEAEQFHLATAKLTESSRLAIVARQREAENAALFSAWLDALAAEQPRRADWLERQFDPPFRAEFERWRATQPADLREAGPDAGRPRFMGLLAGPSIALEVQADAALRQAQVSGDTGDRYGRWTVVLATALFLAGIASGVPGRTGQRLLVGLAALFALVSVVGLLMLPVSFGG